MLEGSQLSALVPVSFHGAEAQKFVQGQQSNDVRKLSPERALLGSCNTGQGRVLAVVTLIERPEGVVVLFPAATLERTLARLRAAVFSTKVSFEVAPLALVAVARAQAEALAFGLPVAPGDCTVEGELTLLRWWSAEERYLLVGPTSALELPAQDPGVADARWHAADIAAGLPQVYADTQSSFVPQILNLDVLGGLSFDKGCYIGQEVVARARRGGVARRMFRFEANCAAPAPGAHVLAGAVNVGEVVDAAPSAFGCELLAAIDLKHVDTDLTLETTASSALRRSTLPYSVPRERRP